MAGLNAKQVLNNINEAMEELDTQTRADYNFTTNWDRFNHNSYEAHKGWGFKIGAVYTELSIFDWWNDTLSMSQLKQMKAFVENAIKFGFTGYVCFKVGAAGCSNGMWAYKAESTDGYSPKDSDTFYHSFVNGANYYQLQLDGKWVEEELNLRQVKQYLKEA